MNDRNASNIGFANGAGTPFPGIKMGGGNNGHTPLCVPQFCVCEYFSTNRDPREVLREIYRLLVRIWYQNNISFNLLEDDDWRKWFVLLFTYYRLVGMMPNLPTSYRITHGIWMCEYNQMKYYVQAVCTAFFVSS